MITADQLFCHLVGDYVLQSDWMADRKVWSFRIACLHAAVYCLPFLALGPPSPFAFVVMFLSHAIIDRFRLARHLVWLKNQLAPTRLPWSECSSTGYPPTKPAFLSVWLLIIADNVMHIGINAVCLGWL